MISATDSPLGDIDLHLFAEGKHRRIYEKLGSHPTDEGCWFAVWAPNASAVSVVGSFNDWASDRHPLERRGDSGIWEAHLAGVKVGDLYKYRIVSADGRHRADKADPYAILHEEPPATGSVVWRADHDWGDEAWLEARRRWDPLTAALSVYEVHLGSWRRKDGRPMTYREIAPLLADHLEAMGFTHAELMPVMEHPFYGSWGYQGIGYFAPTARYGRPEDLKFLVDHLHQRGLGVIFDWVPSHFPDDEHGLIYFDGTHLYEHADPRLGHHPDWDSAIFDYARHEVRSFLASSASYWIDEFHADGLRVDAVASMLYLDYSREEGEWSPNRYGGNEYLEAISLLREINQAVAERDDGVMTIAEESTAWPGVTQRAEVGGLGFTLKWDMGWMHDTLAYFAHDPIHRQYHHEKLTFRGLYANTEHFLLPLSHDEVVHGKGSLLGKMPGDDWRRRANLRLLYAYMFGMPAKKLLFMGAELGEEEEWDHDGVLDWSRVEDPRFGGIQRCLGDLNRLYRELPALHRGDCRPEGFGWVDCNDAVQSTLSFLRFGEQGEGTVLVVCNFTPVVRHDFRVGVSEAGFWRERFNTDAAIYGGSGQGNMGGVASEEHPHHGLPRSVSITLPPLGAIYFLHDARQ